MCFEIIENYCFRPTLKVLTRIRHEFGIQWKHVGYILGLDHSTLQTIEIDNHDVDKRTTKMLKTWIERDIKSCYCKLITAMTEEELRNKAEILKEQIKSSKFL